MIAIAAPAAEERADVAVDRLDFPEGKLDVAVRENAVEMAAEELGGDLIEGRQTLPAQRAHPRRQEAPRGPFDGSGPS